MSIRHEYLTDASNRNHGIIHVPGSRIMVMSMEYCSITSVQDKDKKLPPENTYKSHIQRRCVDEDSPRLRLRCVQLDVVVIRVFGYEIDKLGRLCNYPEDQRRVEHCLYTSNKVCMDRRCREMAVSIM